MYSYPKEMDEEREMEKFASKKPTAASFVSVPMQSSRFAFPSEDVIPPATDLGVVKGCDQAPGAKAG